MATFKVFFQTVVEQCVEVEADDFEDAIDIAYDQVKSVPFIGWEFDASGDWDFCFAENEETGDTCEY